MAERSRRLQARAILSNWLSAFIVLTVLLATFGGYATFTAYAAPGTTEATQTTEAWTVNGEFSHSATVTEQNPVFPVGTQLEERSTYFRSISPIMHGTFTLQQRPPAETPVSVSLDAYIRTRSVSEQGGTVYWQTTTPLDSTTVERLTSGKTAQVDFQLNASRVLERRNRITSQLGGSPGTLQTAVVVNASVTGSVDGTATTREFASMLPLSFSDSTYSVGSSEPVRETATHTQTITVPQTYGPLYRIGGPLALLIGLVTLGGLLVAKRGGELALSDTERDRLAFERDREEFDDWIVRAHLPDGVHDRDFASADTLADVVDFAIDADTGVIEDATDGRFYALSSELALVYSPPHPVSETEDEMSDADDSPADTDVETTDEADGDGDDTDVLEMS